MGVEEEDSGGQALAPRDGGAEVAVGVVADLVEAIAHEVGIGLDGMAVGEVDREALGKQVRELVAERVSTAEATTTIIRASSSSSGGSGNGMIKEPAASQNRLTKVLKRKPSRARLPEGPGVVSVPLTAEERRSQARATRRGLEQMKAERKMAENKVERRREAEWAKVTRSRRTGARRRSASATRRRRTRCTSACGARRRLRRTMSAR